MKKKYSSILALIVVVAIAATGLSVISVRETNAEEVTPLATLNFEDSSDIANVHDSAAVIKNDSIRGNVISLGEGNSSDMVGAEVTNAWGSASINTTGAKAYSYADVVSTYNEALGTKAEADVCTTSRFFKRAEGTGGSDWTDLTISAVTMMNGAVAEARNYPDMTIYVNDVDGNYAGADMAKQAMGDTKAATIVTDNGASRKANGNDVKVSAYKPEKEDSYFRPVWDKNDGLSMNFWVKVPEGTNSNTILFSFFNESFVKRFGEETETGENLDRFNKFNNYTGHLYFMADGSIQFVECSIIAGMSAIGGDGVYQYGKYPASRNRYEAKSVGNSEGVTPSAKAGQWVYVSLVFENDYISVYYDGNKVNYIESNVTTSDTDNGKFTQDWDKPENSPSWVRSDVATAYKAFNGYFASRNVPTYQLVNAGIYSQIPSWVKSDNKPMTQKIKFQKYEFMPSQEGSQKALLSSPRITLCQWLQDVDTILYLGGASGKDLASSGGSTTTQYTCKADTQFDSISFYKEALTDAEVINAYKAAGGTAEVSEAPAESEKPTDSPSSQPTAEPSSNPTAVPTAEPSSNPTAVPTAAPTAAPTTAPTAAPTTAPTVVPTTVPTEVPSEAPTTDPTKEPEATPSVAPTETVAIGDVNKDGDVNAKDALAILKHAAKLETIPEDMKAVADVNKDDSIDAKDALKILKVAAKIDPGF